MRRAVSYVDSPRVPGENRSEQQVWNECSRLIAKAILYHNTCLQSRVDEDNLATDID
jgi:hypothetical protein